MLSLIVTWVFWFYAFTLIGVPHNFALIVSGLFGFGAMSASINRKNKEILLKELVKRGL